MKEQQAQVINIHSVIVMDTIRVRDTRIQINCAKGILRDLDNKLSNLMDKRDTENLVCLLVDVTEQIDKLLSEGTK